MENSNSKKSSDVRGEQIIRETVVSKLMIPFIQLFALYIIIHGEVSPGGGFQGGVILGTCIILYILVYGLQEGREKISQSFSDSLSSAGALLFAGIGIVIMLAGGNYLEYDMLPIGDPKFASHISIILVEVAIGIAVAGVMITLFCETIRRDDDV